MTVKQTVMKSVAMVLILAVVATAQTVAPDWPIRVSSNGRYFEDQSGKAFPYHADTCWTLIQSMNMGEVETYLNNRSDKGFTVVQFWALPIPFDGNCTGRGVSCKEGNHAPFHGGVNNMHDPNDAYFDVLDQIIYKAEQKGLVVNINPCWFGYSFWDWATKLTNYNAPIYGQYLGNRMKNHPNVMYWVCGDVDPNYGGNEKRDELDQLCNAIRSEDSDALISGHAATGNPSWNFWNNSGYGAGWYNYHSAYAYGFGVTGARVWQQVRDGVHRNNPVGPTINIESFYEPQKGAEILRRNAWWTITVGGAGHAYGHTDIWCFKGNWGALDATVAQHMRYLGKFFRENPWGANLANDEHGAIVSGHGGDDDKATGILASDGSWFYAYLPTGRTVGIDMSKLSMNPVTAKWYDPTNGNYQNIGDYPNSGTRNFSTPGNNASGYSDWVLVLSTPPLNPPVDLDVVVISGSEIHLSWADNNSNPNEDGYIIQRRPYRGTHGDWSTLVDNLPAGITSYTDTDSIYGMVEYIYRVGAFKN